MIAQRDTRVQIVIIENGKYILLEHLAKKENITFWGLPGGGREPGETDEAAAIREAQEETGLVVRLLPVKHEVLLPGKKFLYRRVVTFLAYPVSGRAHVGYEPEAQLMSSYNYKLIGIKWQDFFNDDGLETFTKKSIQPVRELLRSAPISRKSGLLAYHRANGDVAFLLACPDRHSPCWTLPQIAVTAQETAEDAVEGMRRWMRLPMGRLMPRGFFFAGCGGYSRTDVFSLRLDTTPALLSENSPIYWIAGEKAVRKKMVRGVRQSILAVMAAPEKTPAASSTPVETYTWKGMN